MGIDSLKDALDGLELHFGDLLSELKGANADDVFGGGGFEAELDLALGLGLAADFGVVDEAVAGPGVGRHLAGAGELEALDDGGFAGAVVADDYVRK